MVKEIRISLHGKALEQFYWMKQELDLEDDGEVIKQIFHLAMDILQKTQGGKEAVMVRKK